MTTMVTVRACCNSATTEVVVTETTENTKDMTVLQDGESYTVNVWDDRQVIVQERTKKDQECQH